MADAEASQRIEIKLRHRRRSRAKARTAPQIATLRLRDLAKLFRARYGITLPDDDAGRDDLYVALTHVAQLNTARERMHRYLEIWAPWLTLREARSTVDHALTNPRRWTADQLAWRMRLTLADRTALGITTIGAVDLNKAGRKRLRKARSKARSKAYRERKRAANAP